MPSSKPGADLAANKPQEKANQPANNKSLQHPKPEQTKNEETLTGMCERVTFHQPDNGFCVLKVAHRGQRELATVVGFTPHISAGEMIEACGEWICDRRHGMQFKASTLVTTQPTSTLGMQKYLASGMVRGIGPVFAKKLVASFGSEVFDVIENQPDRLKKLGGIGAKRISSLQQSWSEQKVVREVMVFLQAHGVGTSRAVRIYKTYGDSAVSKVQENPYRLALDIHGIGFKTADALAMNLGLDAHSLIRARAGIRHVLQQIATQGHVAAYRKDVLASAVKLLEIPLAIIEEAIDAEVLEENLVAAFIHEQPCLYLKSLYAAEQGVVKQLARLLKKNKMPWKEINFKKNIARISKQSNITLSESQQQAISMSLQHKIMIITGGPGVGKTTVVNSILKMIQGTGAAIALCAPTGRAAKRLQETTGIEAKTIHRLLEFNPINYNFKHHLDHPLPIDYVVVDEVSMLDIRLMHDLLKAIPTHAALLLVGDVDQLPSVGPGMVLYDLLASKKIPSAYLNEIFRQHEGSQIIVNAHAVNEGKIPIPMTQKETLSDFYYLPEEEIESIQRKLIKMVCERIPQRFSFNPIADIQVLTPMHNGALGARTLNQLLQEKLNGHSEPKIQRFGTTYAPGDKVIQLVNNYKKEVFNGDLGIIQHIDVEEALLHITFDDRAVEYEFSDLDEVSLAYAITIHKSQGSEYPVVVMPLATQHYMLLARNLVYTGLTRGKKLVVLISQKKAIRIAVQNNKQNQRLGDLQRSIVEGVADTVT